jgi:hypothetical protein
MPPKKRIRCTEEEKRWLRDYRTLNPSVKLKEVLFEFERKFNRAIEQSTASTITRANGPSNRISTISRAAGFPGRDPICEAPDPGSIQIETYQGNIQHTIQAPEYETFVQGAELQCATIIPEILGDGFSAGLAGSIDSASFSGTHQRHPLDICPTVTPAMQAHSKALDGPLISITAESGGGERHEQDRQQEGVQSSCAQPSPTRHWESDEWMNEFMTGVAPSPNISPILNATDNFPQDGSSVHSPSGRPFFTEQFQNPSSYPVGTKRRPQADPTSECKVVPNIFCGERPTKRRRVEKICGNDTIDIAESVETLQSLHETSQMSLRSPAFDLVFQALKNILAFTTKESVLLRLLVRKAKS